MKSKPVHHQEVFVMSGELIVVNWISYLVKIRIWELILNNLYFFFVFSIEIYVIYICRILYLFLW